MEKEIKNNKIVGIILILILIGYGVSFSLFFSGKFGLDRLLNSAYTERGFSEGTIDNFTIVKCDTTGKPSFLINYSYYVDGVKFAAKNSWYYVTSKEINEDENCIVVYLKANPKISVVLPEYIIGDEGDLNFYLEKYGVNSPGFSARHSILPRKFVKEPFLYIFIVLGSLLVLWAFYLCIRRFRILKNGIRTDAVIIKYHVQQRQMKRTVETWYTPVLEYTVNNKKYETWGNAVANKPDNEGSTVQIIYNQENPKQTIGEGEAYVSIILMVVGGLFGLLPIILTNLS